MMTQFQHDRVLPLVTCPQIYEHKLVGHRYLVELVSKQVELQEERAVPASTRTIDLVVTEPSKEAIASRVAACSWLKGYEIVSYKEPSFLEAPF
ncbi:hypothetical protein B7486_50500 [cyanobacterium TDX16]|nr:hypothetical protein B7486_50500 [cyanobacterium TDX16]